MSTSSTNTPTPTMTGPSTLILICTKPGSKRSTSTPTTSARQLPAGGHSDVGAVVLRIASLVERRQVAGGRLHQSSVGRNPAVGTVEAGPGPRMLAKPRGHDPEGQPDEIAEAAVQPLVAA